MDLDLRKLRYFVMLAERLHFGRAAEALHIAQPVLSRQIRVFEIELKAVLFVRDRRGVELTDAGRHLLAQAPALLADAEAVRRRVALVASGMDTFTVGFMPGIIVTTAVRTLEAAHPGLTVEVLRTGWSDQIEVLRDGRADVSYVRLPVDEGGLRLRPLATEPRVAVLPSTHRLAGKDAIGIRDLAGEQLLQPAGAVPEWREINPVRYRDTPGMKPVGSYGVEEKLEHVARGRGIAVLPESVARFYRRPDLVYPTIEDIGPNQVSLAWDAACSTGLILEFALLAAEHYES
jgi:DNA-binding transcriptional LysR family regulator